MTRHPKRKGPSIGWVQILTSLVVAVALVQLVAHSRHASAPVPSDGGERQSHFGTNHIAVATPPASPTLRRGDGGGGDMGGGDTGGGEGKPPQEDGAGEWRGGLAISQPQPADSVSDSALAFNRPGRCRAAFLYSAPPLSPASKGFRSVGGVVDVPYAAAGAAVGTAAASGPQRLVTREDVWMAPPIASAVRLFDPTKGKGGGNVGACARERETYRLGVGTATRPSYGRDMLLVSDKYRFVCVVIWKVASRTLLKALEGGLGAVRTEGYALSPAQRETYTTFTFVREPLARYLSGYFSAMKWVKMKRHRPCAVALAAAHAAADPADDLSFLSEGDIDAAAEQAGHPGEPARFRAFTQRLLLLLPPDKQALPPRSPPEATRAGSGGTQPPTTRRRGVAFPGVQHIYTQASFLSVTDAGGAPLFPRVDFVGKLESFAQDWDRLMALLAARPGVPPPPKPQPASIPHRNPSPSGFTQLIHSALNDTASANAQGLLRAVCDFYIQDYLCFGYELPAGCEPPPPIELAAAK